MPPIKRNNTRNQLLVIYRGEEIGILSWNPEKRCGYFFFSKEYFRRPYDLCPITHPKNNPETRFAIFGENPNGPEPKAKIYQGLPPFIADSLPDQWGNAIFDRWFKQHKLPESQKTPLTKLAFIGNRAMGALEFKPMTAPDFYKDKPVNLDELYKEAMEIEAQLAGKILNGEEAKIEQIAALGTSPGGSRKKSLISIAPDGAYRSGKAAPQPGWKDCIIKFNSERFTTSEIEKTYYELAIASGIPMMPSWFIEISGQKHFITERFDRQGGQKIMMQTLAAINPAAETYEDLFKTCRMLGLSENEITNLFRQTVFNFIMNNTDDHVKNFSFILQEDNTWHLSPAYDMTFIIAENAIRPQIQHCMSLGGKYSNITDEDLILFARKNSIKAPERIIKTIREQSLKFEELARINGVNSYYIETISDQLDKLGRPNPNKRIKEYNTQIGDKKISDFHFEMTTSGNIHILATIDGNKWKRVITPNKPLHSLILKQGFNSMPSEQKNQIIETILLQKRNN